MAIGEHGIAVLETTYDSTRSRNENWMLATRDGSTWQAWPLSDVAGDAYPNVEYLYWAGDQVVANLQLSTPVPPDGQPYPEGLVVATPR